MYISYHLLTSCAHFVHCIFVQNKQLGVVLLSPKWDSSPLQGYPSPSINPLTPGVFPKKPIFNTFLTF